MLSASVPGGFGVGSAYLDALLATPGGKVIGKVHPGAKSDLTIFDWPDERYGRRGRGYIGTLGSLLHYGRSRIRSATVIAKRIETWCKEHDIKQLWTILESPMSYRLASILARGSGLEMVATVWDPPNSVARQFGLDRISRNNAVKDFETALSCCSRLGVISEAMGKHFERTNPNLQTAVMRLTPEKIDTTNINTNPDEFVIAFAGSLYASDEFNALLAALDCCNWMIAGRNVRVKVMGAAIHHKTQTPACIEFLGYRSSDDVQRVMAAADCGYVPYWFNPVYASAVQLCFPSKLITCLISGTPILFHGPKNSTPADFLHNYSAGIACHCNDADAIIESLRQLAHHDRHAMANEASRAIDEEFNNQNFTNRFHWLITGTYTTV